MPKDIKYEVVHEDGGGYAVKAEIDGKYHTAADCFCIDGDVTAKEMAGAIASFLNGRVAIGEMYLACRCALADLEGIMPDFEPSGDREHPAWKTMEELSAAIELADEKFLFPLGELVVGGTGE